MQVAAAEAAWRTAAQTVARFSGYPLDRILEARRPGKPRIAGLAFAQSAAIYLAVTVFDTRQYYLALALGRPRRRIHAICHAVEDRRDCPEIDRLLGTMERVLSCPEATL